jgi:hypothetical protein
MIFDVVDFFKCLIWESSLPDEFAAALHHLPMDWHEYWDERAAWLEIEGKYPREKAEALALRETVARMEKLRDVASWTDREQFLFLQMQEGLAVVSNIITDRNLIAWARSRGLFVDITQGAWANPAAVLQFEFWLDARPELIERLPELRGHVLGCTCGPRRCHGDYLARQANRLGTAHQTGNHP